MAPWSQDGQCSGLSSQNAGRFGDTVCSPVTSSVQQTGLLASSWGPLAALLRGSRGRSCEAFQEVMGVITTLPLPSALSGQELLFHPSGARWVKTLWSQRVRSVFRITWASILQPPAWGLSLLCRERRTQAFLAMDLLSISVVPITMESQVPEARAKNRTRGRGERPSRLHHWELCSSENKAGTEK